MSIVRCATCHIDYWKYPGAPIAGYCSINCKDERKKKAKEIAAPEIPQIVVAEIRQHLQAVHQTADLTAWFPDCLACDRLEQRYNAALADAA